MSLPMVARPASASAVQEQAYLIFPNDLNSNDTVFGGLIMAQMDRLAAVVADRHACGVCVTVSVDAVHFLTPAKKGDILFFNASVNRAWNTSLEVGVRVEAEAVGSNERRHVLSAYLTFVAVDSEGKPRPVPPLELISPDQQRRFEEAQLRRETRLEHAKALTRLRSNVSG